MKNTKQFLHVTKEVFDIYFDIAPKTTIAILLTNILMSLQGMVNIYLFALLLDRIVTYVSNKETNPYALLPSILLYGVFSLLFLIITDLNDYFNSILSSLDVFRLRLKQMDFTTSLGISQLENPEFNNKTTRYSEVYTTLSTHLSVLIAVVSLFISAIVTGAVLLTFQPLLIALYSVLFVVKYINNTRFRNQIWKLSKENTERRRSAWNSAGFLVTPNSVKEMLISGGIHYLRSQFLDYANWFYKEYSRIRTRWSVYEISQGFFDIILFTIGIFVIVQKGVDGVITIGAITFYFRSLSTFSDQIDRLSYRIGRAAEGSVRIQDALEMFKLYSPESDGQIILSNSLTSPSVELKNVSFKYPHGKSNVLDNLSLSIKPGEKVAIVGENGAGKTTLVKIITRIYKPQLGIVFADGVDVNEVKLQSWYKKIGVLFQDFNTYENLSVLENVGIGESQNKHINRKLVVDALKKADIYKVVQKYPNRLNQILSEKYKGGIRPSGGQWQKIAIARFFYRNSPLLILDEPTAAIDAVSEAQIFNNIYKFMKGKTVIIISHRFSTVRNADRIIVLDKGKIIEDGTHKELLALNGKYSKSFQLQAKGYS